MEEDDANFLLDYYTALSQLSDLHRELIDSSRDHILLEKFGKNAENKADQLYFYEGLYFYEYIRASAYILEPLIKYDGLIEDYYNRKVVKHHEKLNYQGKRQPNPNYSDEERLSDFLLFIDYDSLEFIQVSDKPL